MNKHIGLRPATHQDADFMYHLLKTSMQTYVAEIWGWDETWQQTHFREHFDPSKEQIIVMNGQDVGVFAVEKRTSEIFLSKIYLLPDYQGCGIGSQLIKNEMHKAAQQGLAFSLQVLISNKGARRTHIS